MFPPDTTATTRLPATSSFPDIIAATAAAPAPSATIFCFSMSARMALATSSSLTSTSSSTYSLTREYVFSPGCFTAMPSAMVETDDRHSIWPLFTELNMLGAPVTCTPYTLTDGLICLTVYAIPEISPPPPTGTTMASILSMSLSISRAIVPCPAITFSSSNGWTNVYPFSSRSSSALRYASS